MRRPARIAVVLLALLGLSVGVHGQQALTNEDIVKMVKAGLAEDLVLSMVAGQPSKFLTAPDDLIALKKQGVPDKVIAAMVARSQKKAPETAAPPAPPSTRTDDRPTDAEILAAIRSDPNRNDARSSTALVMSTTPIGSGTRLKDVQVTVEGFRLLQWGAFNTADKYWPVELCVNGTADNRVLANFTAGERAIAGGPARALKFETRARYRLYRNDFGETKAQQLLVNEWKPQDAICPRAQPAPTPPPNFLAGITGRAPAPSEPVATTCDAVPTCLVNAALLLARGQYAEATRLWDEGLRLGGPVEFQMCWEGGVKCTPGTLKLSPETVSFTDSKSTSVVNAALKDVTVLGFEKRRVLGGESFVRVRIRVGGKDFNFAFMPDAPGCQQGRYYGCPSPGLDQQDVVARYLAEKMKKAT